jgi:hypothetical protein
VCRGRPGTLLIWLCNQLGTIKFNFRVVSLLENGQLAAHIRRMTGRDQWTENLRCPKCGLTGSVELSQASGQAYSDGDQAVRVDGIADGFKAVQFEYGSNFYCSSCDSPVEP